MYKKDDFSPGESKTTNCAKEIYEPFMVVCGIQLMKKKFLKNYLLTVSKEA